MQMPPVIVLGLSPTGLYAVREAGRAGFTVVGVTDSFACGSYSRYLRHPGESWLAPTQTELLERLVTFASRSEHKPVLLPTNDRYIEFIGRHAQTLSACCQFPDAYRGISQELMDKRAFNLLCREHGLVTPGVWETEDKESLSALAGVIPFPCILKPALIHRAVSFLKGKKVLLARDEREFRSLVASIPVETGGWLVQEVIPGPESNITLFGGYFNRSGQPLQTFTARKLRQYPVGFGSASLVRSEPCPETLEKSLYFLQKLRFSGVCGTEFKRDPRDGQLKIIEINPRPTLWFSLTNAAGKRIVETACRDLAGLPIADQKPQVNGILWRYALKDTYSALFYRAKGGSFIFPTPELQSGDNPVRGKTWPVFDSEDPLPTLAEPIQFLKKIVSRFRKCN